MNRTRLDLALFKFALYLGFVALLIAGIAIGGAAFAGYRGFSVPGAMIGLLLGAIAGILSAGYGLTLLSINDHLQAIRAASGAQAPELPARAPETRFYYVGADKTAQGPLALSALRAKLERGELAADTRVAKAGDKVWVELAQMLATQEGKA
jgi:hypothetical protein